MLDIKGNAIRFYAPCDQGVRPPHRQLRAAFPSMSLAAAFRSQVVYVGSEFAALPKRN